MTASAGAVFLADTIKAAMRRFIPERSILVRATHPWIDRNCLEAVSRKMNAIEPEDISLAARQCSDIDVFFQETRAFCTFKVALLAERIP